jgi:hypothetical protein
VRPYSIIAPTIWTGDTGREWKTRGPFFQLVGHYLAESPSSNQYGLYYQPLAMLLDDVFPPTMAAAARDTALTVLAFFHDTGYAHYDVRSQWVFVTNMWERQFLAGGTREVHIGDKRVLGLHRWYHTCPINPYLGAFYDRYASDFGLPRRRDASDRRIRYPAEEPAVMLSEDQRALCDRWLDGYPVHRKTGRAAIYAAWGKLEPPPTPALVETMVAKLALQVASPKWTDNSGQFVPGAVRYLEEHRWLDDVEDAADQDVQQWLRSKQQ